MTYRYSAAWLTARSLWFCVAKSEEAAPAGRPPGLQIPHSPRMVSPRGNSCGGMPWRQERLGSGWWLATRFSFTVLNR
jgi:hypothetical protein